MRRSRASRTLLTVLALVLALLWAFPVYWMLNSAFLPNVVLQSTTPTFLPFGGSMDNFRVVAHRPCVRPGPRRLARGDADDGGGRARRGVPRGPGDQPLPVPGQGLVRRRPAAHPDAPGGGAVHRAVQDDVSLGLLNRSLGLAVLYTAAVVPFTIWMLRGFVAGVPADLEEAAMVDGLSRAKAFLKVTFPLLAPGLVASGVYAFLQAWNEFTVALVVMTEEKSRTLPLWLRDFVQASASRGPTGARSGGLDPRRAPRRRLLPRRPGPDGQRAGRRGGEGMSLSADVAATLLPVSSARTCPPGRARTPPGSCRCVSTAQGSGPDGLAALCTALLERLPEVLLAVDEEGGDVTRLHCPAVARRRQRRAGGRSTTRGPTRDAAARDRGELTAYRIGLDLAPVVDVNSSPDNPVIGVRASARTRPSSVDTGGLGGGPAVDGVAGLRQALPGPRRHGRGLHPRLPRVDVPLDELREAGPFRAAVAAGVASVMTSHIVVEALDPSACRVRPPGPRRPARRLRFRGVIVSDALDMAGRARRPGIPDAAVRALAAGVDLLCLGSRTTEERYAGVHAAVLDAARSGRLAPERVD